MTTRKQEQVFLGNGVSAGIALGNALKLDSHRRIVLKVRIYRELVEEEVQRFYKAVQTSKRQLEELKTRFMETVGKEHSYILDAHLLMLEDRSLLSEIESNIRQLQVSAEWAVRRATDRLRQAYESLEDEYFRERGKDMESVVERILMTLSGEAHVSWAPLPEDFILVGHEFNLSAFGMLELEKLRGLALEVGGRTSHTAIVARSLRIPAVMEATDFLSHVSTGDTILLDADRGEVILNPSGERLDRVRDRLHEFQFALRNTQYQAATPAVTRDNAPISLQANIELPHEVRAAKRCGAEGIGLFRSEFIFLANPNGFPGMQAQQQTYELLAAEMHPHPVAIRTLDVGADKSPSFREEPLGMNPSMGLRGIRLSLHHPDAFRTQIEAILRASAHGRVEIILPMISTIEEVREARSIVEGVRDRLSGAGVVMGRTVPLGIMIEVPSAVLMLESLAEEVDFLCVGTNDLIQYTLAVDRNDPQVSHLFQPLHPAVVHSLSRIATVCSTAGKPVRVCGEIAGNPFFATLLIGFGFSRFSVNAYSVPVIRRVVAGLTVLSARKIADRALSLPTSRELGDYLLSSVPQLISFDLAPYAQEVRGSGDQLSPSHVT